MTSLSKSGVNGEVSGAVNGIWSAPDKAERLKKKATLGSNIFKVGSPIGEQNRGPGTGSTIVTLCRHERRSDGHTFCKW